MKSNSTVTISTGGFLPTIQVGSAEIATYFLVNSIVASIVLYLTVLRARRLRLSERSVLDQILIGLLAAFLGARLIHVFIEEPRYYLEAPSRLLEIWRGGFVWYGGLLAAIGSTWLYCRKQKLNFLFWADFFAPSLALGYGLGRLSCLLTGCCHGRYCDIFGYQVQYPTQAFAILWDLALAKFLLWKFPKVSGFGKGRAFLYFLGLHSSGRVIMECFRGDARGPVLLNLGPSGWLSIILVLGSLWYLRRPK